MTALQLHVAPSRRMLRSDALGSVGFYASGTAALLILDIYLSHRLNAEKLAEYASFKSSLYVCGSVVLIGIDQALTRVKIEPRSLLLPLAAQVSILALPVGLASGLASGSGLPIWIAIALLGFAQLYAHAGHYRFRYELSRSQAAMHGWKVPLAPSLIVCAIYRPQLLVPTFTVVLCVAAICSSLVIGRRKAEPGDAGVPQQSYREILSIGTRYWYLGFVANGLIYSDQLLLNARFGPMDSATYFRLSTILLPLPAFVAGLGGNLLNPAMRDYGEQLRQTNCRLWSASALSFVTCHAANLLLATGACLWVPQISSIPGKWSLMLGLISVSILRTAYVFPSAVVGIFGNKKELSALAGGGITSLVCMVLTFLSFGFAGFGPFGSIIAAGIVAGLVRLALSCIVASRIFRSDRDLLIAVEAIGSEA